MDLLHYLSLYTGVPGYPDFYIALFHSSKYSENQGGSLWHPTRTHHQASSPPINSIPLSSMSEPRAMVPLGNAWLTYLIHRHIKMGWHIWAWVDDLISYDSTYKPVVTWLKRMLLSAEVFHELCFFTRSAPSIPFLWLLLSPTLVSWNKIDLFSYDSGAQRAEMRFHWPEFKMWACCAPSRGYRRTHLLAVPPSGGSWHSLAGGHFALISTSKVTLPFCLCVWS